MVFSNEIEKNSYKERLFFKHLNNLYNIFPTQKYDVEMTSYYGDDCYDVIVRSKENNCYKRFLIEIKIRTKSYSDGYVYEKLKHKNLISAKNIDPDNNTILYINSTPDGTYIWNIDKLVKEKKLQSATINMNRITCISKTDKIDKGTYLLKPEDSSKFYEYHFTEDQFIEDMAKDYVKEQKIKNKIKEDKCIFRGLLNKKN